MPAPMQEIKDEPGLLRFITCGSVDDGKSTLIGRLLYDSKAIFADQLAAVESSSRRRGQSQTDLSLLTDGLQAEREQGITIDVAYRYFSTPRRRFIIADTPGHEQYTRNMVTGASTAQAAVILLDAGKGVLPQTRRHTYLARLLGVRHVVVAVNKMDLVEYAQAVFDRLRADFLEFAAPLNIPDLRFVPISALRGNLVVERGEGMAWYDGPTLIELLEAIEPQDDALARPLRFPVQLVLRPDAGRGVRGYMGRIESGIVLPGAEVAVLPSARTTVVREILSFDGPRSAAVAGDAVTLVLRDELDVSRGDMIAAAQAQPLAARVVEAKLCWLGSEPSRPGARYLLRHTTRTVHARIAAVNYRVDVNSLDEKPAEAALAMNDIAQVALKLQQPIFCDAYASDRATGAFILIDEASNQTVAAGMIE